jgi:hypothetical protein
MGNKQRLFIVTILIAFASPAFAQREGGGGIPGVRGIVKSLDTKAGMITITSGGGRESAPTEKTYTLAKNVEVCVAAGGGFRAGAFFKEAKLADLTAGANVGLILTADQKTIDSIIVEEPTIRGVVKMVDVQKKTLTIATTSGGGRERAAAETETTYAVTPDTEIAVDDGRGRRFSIHEGKLEDLAQGAHVTVKLSLDKKSVTSILAEGATISGVVKDVNPAKKTITVTTRPARGDDGGEERVLTVAREALVLIDDGKGRRLSIKEAKLADVPVGAMIVAKLSTDQAFVMMMKAEGPTVTGILKSVDVDKGAITIAIPKSRTEFDEMTYILIKGGRVNIDGNDAKLADLKVGDNGPFVQVRLGLDQKTAQSVISRQPGSR